MTCWFQLWYISPGWPPLLPTRPEFNPSLLGSSSKRLASFPEGPGHLNLPCLPEKRSLPQMWLLESNGQISSPPRERTRSYTTNFLSPFPSPTQCAVGPTGCVGEWGIPAQPVATGHVSCPVHCAHVAGTSQKDFYSSLHDFSDLLPSGWSLRSNPPTLGWKIFHHLSPAHLSFPGVATVLACGLGVRINCISSHSLVSGVDSKS